jgi:hypothetical protein
MIRLITDPGDPGLELYRELRDRHLRRSQGVFVAESELGRSPPAPRGL